MERGERGLYPLLARGKVQCHHACRDMYGQWVDIEGVRVEFDGVVVQPGPVQVDLIGPFGARETLEAILTAVVQREVQ